MDEFLPRAVSIFTVEVAFRIFSVRQTLESAIVPFQNSIIISPESLMAGFGPMTLLIPSVYATSLPCVAELLHGNTLNTHFDLVWQYICSTPVSA